LNKAIVAPHQNFFQAMRETSANNYFLVVYKSQGEDDTYQLCTTVDQVLAYIDGRCMGGRCLCDNDECVHQGFSQARRSNLNRELARNSRIDLPTCFSEDFYTVFRLPPINE
jgi:hypothetical protein